MFRTKDQLLNYLIAGHIHLGKKDYNFFANITYNIKDRKPITTNQAKLFDKLVSKYSRQLKKLGHNVEELLALEWAISVIETRQEFIEARLFIDNDELKIRSPFNSKFINFVRQTSNTFQWDKQEKTYVSPMTTDALKFAYHHLKLTYETVKFCDKVQECLDHIFEYDKLLWEPTLKKVNGKYFIVPINNALYDATKHIELNDDPNNLLELSTYGIEIDTSICDSALKTFASKFIASINLDSMSDLVEYLKLLKIDHVFSSRDIVYNKLVSKQVKETFDNTDIKLSPFTAITNDIGILIRAHDYSMQHTVHHHNIVKVINIVNTRPIKIA